MFFLSRNIYLFYLSFFHNQIYETLTTWYSRLIQPADAYLYYCRLISQLLFSISKNLKETQT